MARNLRPLFDRVLIQRVVAEKKTASGLLLPESVVKSQRNEGVVVSVGPGTRIEGDFVPISLKVGERVLLPEFGGQPIKFDDDNDYLIIRDKEILGVLEN